MSNYRVNIDIYNGPLDLLLYLIRRNEVDIYDIPIAMITSQYLEYVELIKQLDLDKAADFLVMAATLMEIKSAQLLPRDAKADDSEDQDLSDPRLELVRQLLEYKKFKDVAGQLGQWHQQRAQRFPRPIVDLERVKNEIKQQQELDMESLHMWDLFDAFNRLMQATLAGQQGHRVIRDDTPIDIYEVDVLQAAQDKAPLLFDDIFRNRSSREEMIGLFLALLELIRQKLIRIEQEKAFGAIYIYALTTEPAQDAVARTLAAEHKGVNNTDGDVINNAGSVVHNAAIDDSVSADDSIVGNNGVVGSNTNNNYSDTANSDDGSTKGDGIGTNSGNGEAITNSN